MLKRYLPRMIDDALKLTVDKLFPSRKPGQKAYPVEGYSDDENLWDLLIRLGSKKGRQWGSMKIEGGDEQTLAS